MNALRISIAFLIIGVLFLSFSLKSSEGEDPDYYSCVEKYDSKWGANCPDCKFPEQTYSVSLRNNCKDALDIQVAVQNKNKEWQVYYKENFQPNDTITAWACKGTGKYRYWLRKAGDLGTTFYNQYEINSIYKND